MLQLVYFPAPGRAEAIRIALELSSMEWEDVSVDGAGFQVMKENGELPWDMLPVLITPEGTIAESSAILRFVGQAAGLVPDDPYQRAKADEFIDGMGPLAQVLDPTFGIPEIEERVRLRKALFEPGGGGARNLELLQRKVSQSQTGWAAGTDDMSIADLKLFTGLFGLFSGNYDGIEGDVLSGYTGLLEYHALVANEPRIRKHYSNVGQDDIRWTFLPGAFDGRN